VRFPAIRAPRKDDICYATQNRQDAVKRLAPECDVVLVIGSRNSSNSNRLREVAELQGARAYMIDGPDDIRSEWLAGAQHVGLTAGASAPEVLVQQVLARLRAWGAEVRADDSPSTETIVFPIPKALRAG
jgi:4-hydroxy-3-methylbut-2-enyl diphosphate reductase